VKIFYVFKDKESTEKQIFLSGTTFITYKDRKIITQESIGEELDYDPSEGQDWNWEDYE
tara:strand:+ start:1052 stop:1228 length:177 start_codon:yes stop_codon:yes gene_type:complete